MIHKVREWMSSPVIIIDKDSSVSYALKLMRQRNIHSLVVQIDQLPNAFGIITSSDIRDKIFASDKNPAETSVNEIMSHNIITANPDWDLKECSIVMQKHNIHHLPVVDKNNNLLGIISVTDLFIAAEEIGW